MPRRSPRQWDGRGCDLCPSRPTSSSTCSLYTGCARATRALGVAPCGEVLERAHPEVARRYPGQHGSRQGSFPQDSFSRGDRSKGPGGGHAHCCHSLTHDVLAQDRTKRGSAVAAARERSPTGALELNVVAHAVTAHYLA